ncbi:excisionase family DNA binding protein [Haloactinospora alba]|uniref:Excisionase family DNA binding protein n=1 Tax=Haloactinospora alba TaxID=405555 RepID=A0A543NK42_9ACTN|nr:helix-turn-helix domain-containing protein [Haloactinospora alba]TQN32177.1 excisionase family DNA binding protein [Haloactinospora alba]
MEVYTPSEAAEKLKVPESWLRKKATQRAVPCTFIGKHLRFTAEDLVQIVHEGAQEAVRDKHSDSGGRHTTNRKRRR